MTQSNNRKRRRIAAIMDDIEDDDEDDDEGYSGPRLPTLKGNTLTKEMAGFYLDKKFFEQQHNNLQPKVQRSTPLLLHPLLHSRTLSPLM